jgi:hypothetical protein
MEARIGGVKMKRFLKTLIMKSDQENFENLKFHIGYVKRFVKKMLVVVKVRLVNILW